MVHLFSTLTTGLLVAAVLTDTAVDAQRLRNTVSTERETLSLETLNATANAQQELEEFQEAFEELLETYEMLDVAMSIDASDVPSQTPSSAPSDVPSSAPSTVPGCPPMSLSPTTPAPTAPNATLPPVNSTLAPTTALPTTLPTALPVTPIAPIVAPLPTPAPMVSTLPPISIDNTTVSSAPTPSVNFTMVPTTCPGISSEQRIEQILAILDSVADPDDIRNNDTPQGLATTWLIENDARQLCPVNDVSCALVQRWSLAVMYYSAGGDAWFQCSASVNATDNCGGEAPFVGATRFLSADSECDWAGISCINSCISEIEFELNNLEGTICTEIGLLSGLAIWGMEQGRLSSTIPTEIGNLTNLIFLDLDFNQLTGTLTSQLLSLSSLTQLDLNNNQFSGSINGIGVYPQMEFLQLHDNLFTGTVPEAVGTYSALRAFTLHETAISGTMPQSVCDLRATEGEGVLASLIADCSLPTPDIVCTCCSDCRAS